MSFCLLNAAEAGLDDAIWAINENDWSDWQSTASGTARYKPPHSITVEDGTQASVHTLITNLSNAPVIYSDASATMGNGEVVSKQLRITYERVAPGAGGIVSKSRIVLQGQATFDSYNSSKGRPHPTLNRGDKIVVGTTSKAADSLSLSGQVDIYGYAGTGNAKPRYSGPNNKVLGAGSQTGINIDETRIYSDFTYEFPEVVEPDWSGAATTLPPAVGGVITLGDPSGSLQKYKIDDMRLVNESLNVIGPIQVHTEKGMTVGSKATIEVGFAGQLEVFTPNDVKIAGQAILNKTNQPKNFKIHGTSTKLNGQTFSLAGQGMMEAVFNFPNGKTQISGKGDLAGAIISNEVHFTGQMGIHYDETLGSSHGNKGGISNWHELKNPKHIVDLAAYAQKNLIKREADYVAQLK